MMIDSIELCRRMRKELDQVNKLGRKSNCTQGFTWGIQEAIDIIKKMEWEVGNEK